MFQESLIFMNPEQFNIFKTIFLSILLEALPFIIVGAVISAIIQVFLTPEKINKIIPKNRGGAILTASLLGFIFPVCECAIIPITRSLIKKGMPLHAAISFMLAAPILNPIVLLSTYYAFRGYTVYLLLRAIMAFILATIIAYVIGITTKGDQLLNYHHNTHNHNHNHYHNGCGCCSDFGHSHNKLNRVDHVLEVINHTGHEFFDVGKFLILGAFMSALIQVYVPRSLLLNIGSGNILSIIIMMALAFILSLCSEADAFIARTFVGQFTTGSILGFILMGPMLDIKNTLMMMGTFKGKFVLKLTGLIILCTFLMANIINFIGI
ncbi:permease [Alkaliphilus transvaalensis]|uniref:permease n=1 Tax=Alkaliphilus transvaalensis TaxID=114628 RepID=UPI000684A23F|nr:permease [Alkaliphilus transvaalensis]